MKRYSFVVDVEINEDGLSKEELAVIKSYVATKSAIREAVRSGIDMNHDAFRDIDPLRCVKVKVS